MYIYIYTHIPKYYVDKQMPPYAAAMVCMSKVRYTYIIYIDIYIYTPIHIYYIHI